MNLTKTNRTSSTNEINPLLSLQTSTSLCQRWSDLTGRKPVKTEQKAMAPSSIVYYWHLWLLYTIMAKKKKKNLLWNIYQYRHILGYKTHLNKFKTIEIIQQLLLDHSEIKLEINNKYNWKKQKYVEIKQHIYK